MKILFIGSNPSCTSSTNEAFSPDTDSGRILRRWTEGIDEDLIYENLSSQKTPGNRPLNRDEMTLALVSLRKKISSINPDRIVALGKSATKALNKLEVEFLELPHPSGLNRKLNDKVYTEECIRSLRLWCRDRSTGRRSSDNDESHQHDVPTESAGSP